MKRFDLCRSPIYRPLLRSSYLFFVLIPADIAHAATVTYAARIVPRAHRFAMEEEESIAANGSVSTPSKKESGYFEENCGDLSDVIFSNYNHYGALLSVDTAGILIINETRRSENWENSRQGSFSSGLVEDINDLDVNDSDEAKDDVVIKNSEEAKRVVIEGSEEVIYDSEDSKELVYTHEDSEVILCTREDPEAIIHSEAPVCTHEDSKAVVYLHESPEIIDCTEEDSTNVECAMSPSSIAENWDNVEITDTGKTISVNDNRVISSSYGPFCSAKNRVFSSLVLCSSGKRLLILR